MCVQESWKVDKLEEEMVFLCCTSAWNKHSKGRKFLINLQCQNFIMGNGWKLRKTSFYEWE
jgi:hypothetical protein